MIVMKFGGTSVQDAEAIETAVSLIERRIQDHPLVVVSACAGVTNALQGLAQGAGRGGRREAMLGIESLLARHRFIAAELLQTAQESVFLSLDRHCAELRDLVFGISTLRELTPRALDQCMAYGELWSSMLLAEALSERGIDARWQDARDIMITGPEFTQAVPEFSAIEKRCREQLKPLLDQSAVVVTQGFIGSTVDGRTTTIGRGGSDYSATLFGAALDAAEIQIWTDVDGILTADPSIIPDAGHIAEMSYQEASELAYFGAKVLHPRTILPAIEKNIPVKVLNSKEGGEGTLIRKETAPADHKPVKSIAYKEGITVLRIMSTRMLMNYGFLARVFSVFESRRKSIDVVTTSEVGISVTLDDERDVDALAGELREFSEVTVERHRAVVCVVGEQMRQTRGVAANVFTSLDEARINVEMISQGGSEINLTFVIREEEIETAVRALHDRFFRNGIHAGTAHSSSFQQINKERGANGSGNRSNRNLRRGQESPRE
jgi:aspartate kinase